MKTVALRFTDKFAPEDGTIENHNKIIKKNGYVWYGKFGNKLSSSTIEELLDQKELKILLVQSSSSNRYWGNVDKIQYDTPEDIENIPEYYRDDRNLIKCWFRVTKITKAPSDITSKCEVVSSKRLLSEASRHSMNSCFVVEYLGENND